MVNAALWASQPGLRFERCRLHVQERSRRHARRLSVAQSGGQPVLAPAVPGRREVLHVELRPRGAGRWHVPLRQHAVQELLARVQRRLLFPRHAGRHARREADPRCCTPESHGGSIGVESDSRKRLSFGANFNTNRSDFGGSSGLAPDSTSATGRPPRWRSRSVRASIAITPSRSTSTPSPIRSRPRPTARATCSARSKQRGVQHPDARQLRALAEDVAAGLHAAARLGRRLRRVQGAGAAAHVRLHPLRPGSRTRCPTMRFARDTRSTLATAARDVRVRRSRLQFQVPPPQRHLPMGVASRLRACTSSGRSSVRIMADPGRFHFGQDIGRTFRLLRTTC